MVIPGALVVGGSHLPAGPALHILSSPQEGHHPLLALLCLTPRPLHGQQVARNPPPSPDFGCLLPGSSPPPPPCPIPDGVTHKLTPCFCLQSQSLVSAISAVVRGCPLGFLSVSRVLRQRGGRRQGSRSQSLQREFTHNFVSSQSLFSLHLLSETKQTWPGLMENCHSLNWGI